jgi:hypothetical protein
MPKAAVKLAALRRAHTENQAPLVRLRAPKMVARRFVPGVIT